MKQLILLVALLLAWPVAGQDVECLIHAPLPWWMHQLPEENFTRMLWEMEDNGFCPVEPGDTMSFSSDDYGLTAVVGPVEIPTGIWTFRLEGGSEYFVVDVVEVSECAPERILSPFVRLFRTGRSAAIVIEAPCAVLFEVGAIDDPESWVISAERLSWSAD